MRKNKQQLDSVRWRKLTEEIKQRDNNLCQICLNLYKKKYLFTAKSVHHIKKRKYYPELAFEKSNLILLCSNCHVACDKNYPFFNEQGQMLNIVVEMEKWNKQR